MVGFWIVAYTIHSWWYQLFWFWLTLLWFICTKQYNLVLYCGTPWKLFRVSQFNILLSSHTVLEDGGKKKNVTISAKLNWTTRKGFDDSSISLYLKFLDARYRNNFCKDLLIRFDYLVVRLFVIIIRRQTGSHFNFVVVCRIMHSILLPCFNWITTVLYFCGQNIMKDSHWCVW